jgi:hypothetical protein
MCGLRSTKKGLNQKEGGRGSRTIVRRARLSVPEPGQALAPIELGKTGVTDLVIVGRLEMSYPVHGPCSIDESRPKHSTELRRTTTSYIH